MRLNPARPAADQKASLRLNSCSSFYKAVGASRSCILLPVYNLAFGGILSFSIAKATRSRSGLSSALHIGLMDVSELFKKLEDQRNAYQDTLKQVQDAIGQAASLSSPPDVPLTMPSSPMGRHFSQQSITFSETGSRRRDQDRRRKPSFPESSALSISDEDSDDESDESLYVQAPLPPRSFNFEDLREHLKSYAFDEHTNKILSSIVSDKGRLQNPSIFPGPRDKVDRRTEFSQFQIFDVGADGAPLEVLPPQHKEVMGKEMGVWHAIKDLNSDEAKERKAVGRITIAREPSPVMFAALHHTYNSSFHMDRIFKHLVDSEASSVRMHNTA